MQKLLEKLEVTEEGLFIDGEKVKGRKYIDFEGERFLKEDVLRALEPKETPVEEVVVEVEPVVEIVEGADEEDELPEGVIWSEHYQKYFARPLINGVPRHMGMFDTTAAAQHAVALGIFKYQDK